MSDELNELIAAMPDGATLTLEEGATYELSGPIRVVGKSGLKVRFGRVTVVQPRGLELDFTASRDCGLDFHGTRFVCAGGAT